MSEHQSSRIGIDVGGTFTDAVIVAADGRVEIAKVPSTPERIERGFMHALAELVERSGSQAGDVGYLAHGSTVATNAIVQRRLARTALITNRGFRDVLAIGTQMRAAVYDLWSPEPEPIVPRGLCIEVGGRLDAQGAEVEPLDELSVRAAAAAVREADVEAVAVMLLFSFLNPAHELRVGELLAEELPGVELSLSCQVVPEFREYVRASTTALNAALLPLMGTYLTALGGEVDGAGISVPLHLMQTNGGVAPAARARELPDRAVGLRPGRGRDRRRPAGRAGRRGRRADLRHGRHDR